MVEQYCRLYAGLAAPDSLDARSRLPVVSPIPTAES
jgi:hypothetical protein